MNDQSLTPASPATGDDAARPMSTIERVSLTLPTRYGRERRFRLFGFSAIVVSLLFLVLLLGSICAKGYTAFLQTKIRLDVFFDPAQLDVKNLATANYGDLVREAVDCVIRAGDLQDSTLVARRIGAIKLITCATPESAAASSSPSRTRRNSAPADRPSTRCSVARATRGTRH